MDRNDPVNVSKIKLLWAEVRDAPGTVLAQRHQKMLGISNANTNVFKKLKLKNM